MHRVSISLITKLEQSYNDFLNFLEHENDTQFFKIEKKTRKNIIKLLKCNDYRELLNRIRKALHKAYSEEIILVALPVVKC